MSLTTDFAVEPINNYFAGGSRRASELARSIPSMRPSPPTISASRSSKKSSKNGRKRVAPSGPTAERIAKGDVVRTNTGAYLAEGHLENLQRTFKADPTKSQAILERLRGRFALSDDPGMSERMFQAGKRYEELVQVSGLGGIGAQNLLAARCGGDAPHMIPLSENAAIARTRIRKAWDILPDEAVKVLHGLLIEGRDAESVGREASMYRSRSECRAAGITVLRIALSMLVAARWA